MKRRGILNSKLASAISEMGHTDVMVIGDCGIPVQDESKRIDLALSEDCPSISQVLSLILDEMIIEKVVVAEEQKNYNPVHFADVKKIVNKHYETLEPDTMPHEDFFKSFLPTAKYIVRTGSMMPWGNVVLVSGIDAKKWFEKEGCITPDYYEERTKFENK